MSAQPENILSEKNQDAWKEDAEGRAMVKRWNDLVHEFMQSGSVGRRSDIARDIESLEGQIVSGKAWSFLYLQDILKMAHTIASAQEIDDACYLGRGPVAKLIATASASLDDREGAIAT